MKQGGEHGSKSLKGRNHRQLEAIVGLDGTDIEPTCMDSQSEPQKGGWICPQSRQDYACTGAYMQVESGDLDGWCDRLMRAFLGHVV